jgi:hypothetical protein
VKTFPILIIKFFPILTVWVFCGIGAHVLREEDFFINTGRSCPVSLLPFRMCKAGGFSLDFLPHMEYNKKPVRGG